MIGAFSSPCVVQGLTMLFLPQHVAVLHLEAAVAVAHGPEALDVQVLQHLVHLLSTGLGWSLAPA